MESLSAQSFPRNLTEVVLVDVSDTPVGGVVADYAGRLHIRHVVTRNLGCAANRNHGAMPSRGRWLAFIDDDCVAAADWLAELVKASHADPRFMVGGRITIAEDANAWAALGQVVTEVVHASCNPSAGEVTFLPGGCILVARDGFLARGGLESRFGLLGAEDRDFCDRWRESGGVLSYCPSAVVRHDHRSTLRGFVRQQFNYGRGEARKQAILRQRTAGSPKHEPSQSRRLRDLIREPLRKLSAARRWQVMLSIPIWLVSYFAGIAWQRLMVSEGGGQGSE
jgi:GT2 family glycosyltransferase